MTISFVFEAPSRSYGRTGKPTGKEQRDYYQVTAIYRPPAFIVDADWEGFPAAITEQFYKELKGRKEGFTRLTRYGVKAGVQRWQLLMAEFIFRPEDIERAESQGYTLAQYAELYRANASGVSSSVYYRGIGFKRFFHEAFTEIVNAALKGASSRMVAIFEIQMRGYKPQRRREAP